MQARASPGKETGNARLVVERRDQLEAAVADPEHGSLDTLALEALAELELGAEQPPMRLDRLAEIVDHHRDMMDRADVHVPILPGSGPAATRRG
jgi:hypothetical protein